MFFVATAPPRAAELTSPPRDISDTFAVLDDHTVAYLDLFGSGAETIAHLRDNGRITLMFCSFSRNSRILRLFGTGRVVRPDDVEFASLQPISAAGIAGTRAAIVIDVERIADACGYAVPYYELVDERPVLDKAHAKATDEKWASAVERNRHSIDGLPAWIRPSAAVGSRTVGGAGSS